MKRIIYSIVCCLAVLALAACNSDEALSGVQPADGNSIRLDLSSASLPLSRATVEATGAELAVSHIDVLIFAENGAMVHHERVSSGLTPREGTVTLAAKRADFVANTNYWVYLIANSTRTEAELAALANLDALRSLKQEDRNIHMTGLTGQPQTFLMDGIAYLKGDANATEPTTPTAIVLNNGQTNDDTELKVTLRRAAAKIVVTIHKGDDVTFTDAPAAHEAGYYLRNMPYSTTLIAGVGGEATLRTPSRSSASYFQWTAERVIVTAYAYEHDWNNQSALEKATNLIVNIPLESADPDGTVVKNSYYQIPISEGKKLERNKYYAVTVTVNAPGAEDPSQPVQLTNISYSVEDWIEETINIGGETDRPVYLTVNEEEMEMRNISDDNTTLRFASSSDVSARVTRVYYIDKFGQTQTQDANSLGITVTPDEMLTGNIDVYSPVPVNNTIRYIEVEVSNEDGVTRQVMIAQYPLEYITNTQGWYSYRSDFGGTTWENPEAASKRVAAYGYNQSTDTWQYDYKYYNQLPSGYEYYSFISKVAEEITEGENRGQSTISYYFYYHRTETTLSTQKINDNNNARMYHVHLTSSSDKYTIGVPRLTGDGITDPGADNAQLVSPSFMIASQLGTVVTESAYPFTTKEMAASHCREYVETYVDPETGNIVHLDDWRLPTEAELKIIMEFQKVEDAAMDVVLLGRYYWSASGEVENPDGRSSSVAIRCIRDAYDDKTPKSTK